MNGQPGEPGGAQMKLPATIGATTAGTWAQATGFAPVSMADRIVGIVPPGPMPRPTTRLAVEPDSATAKKFGGGAEKRQSRPAGASKPERSPVIASGRVPFA